MQPVLLGKAELQEVMKSAILQVIYWKHEEYFNLTAKDAQSKQLTHSCRYTCGYFLNMTEVKSWSRAFSWTLGALQSGQMFCKQCQRLVWWKCQNHDSSWTFHKAYFHFSIWTYSRHSHSLIGNYVSTNWTPSWFTSRMFLLLQEVHPDVCSEMGSHPVFCLQPQNSPHWEQRDWRKKGRRNGRKKERRERRMKKERPREVQAEDQSECISLFQSVTLKALLTAKHWISCVEISFCVWI